MSLKGLFARILGAFVLAIVALAFVSIYSARRVHNSSTEVTQMFERVRLSEELQIHLLSTNREWLLYGLTGQRRHKNNQIRQERQALATLAQLEALVQSKTDQELIDEVGRALHVYLKERIELTEQGLTPGEAYQQANASLREAHKSADDLTEYNIDQATEVAQTNHFGAEILSLIAATVALLVAALIPLAWIKVRNWVYGPIQSLRAGIVGFRQAKRPCALPLQGVTEIQEVTASFNDLTERLTDQRSAQLRFLAGVSHDLRNPLSAIQMAAQHMNSEDPDHQERKEMIEIISRQTAQLNRMVGDFLDASRVESGHLELVKNPQDLCELVRDSVVLHRQLSPRHQIQFVGCTQKIEGEVDATRIMQVLNNLINNAIKYSPNGGHIKVSIGTQENQAVIKVSDEGIGISKEDQDKIFEPFRRTKLTKDTIPGVGLGLSISKHIIEGHGGRVSIQSERRKGSTFIIHLPLVRQKRAVPEQGPRHHPDQPQNPALH